MKTLNEFYGHIKPTVAVDLYRYIDRYYDDNKDAVFGNGFDTPMKFGISKRDALLEILDISMKDFKEFAKQNRQVKEAGSMVNDPLNSALLNVYWKLSHKSGKFKVDDGLKVAVFLAIKMFTSKYNHFMKFEVNKDRMKYFINSLSNNYDIKKHGNLILAITSRVRMLMINHYHKNKRNKMTDKDYIMIIKDMSTRIMSFTKEVIIKYFQSEDKYLASDMSDTVTYGAANNTAKVGAIIDKCIKKSYGYIDINILTLITDKKKLPILVDTLNVCKHPEHIAKKEDIIFHELMDTYVDKYGTGMDEMRKNFVVNTLKIYKTRPSSDPVKKTITDILSKGKIKKKSDQIYAERILLLYYVMFMHYIIKRSGN